ncbi:Exportin/Importin, Cse1-like protein, partial [Pavlovales sp. CCMP2436]
RLLSFQPSGGLAGDADDAPGPLEHCQAAVVECLSLYISKYDEEFAEYLPAFVQRLIAVGTGARYDPLATMSIKFLTSLYAQGSALQDVCEHIVVPNMRLLEADEEMFEDDPAEYIRRDIEGSDADTRRRVCAELIFNHYTAAMLQQHAADPQAQWKAKDVAIYL